MQTKRLGELGNVNQVVALAVVTHGHHCRAGQEGRTESRGQGSGLFTASVCGSRTKATPVVRWSGAGPQGWVAAPTVLGRRARPQRLCVSCPAPPLPAGGLQE